jgi:hypothetical protein
MTDTTENGVRQPSAEELEEVFQKLAELIRRNAELGHWHLEDERLEVGHD